MTSLKNNQNLFMLGEALKEKKTNMITLQYITEITEKDSIKPYWAWLKMQYDSPPVTTYGKILVTILNAAFTQERKAFVTQRDKIREMFKNDPNWKKRGVKITGMKNNVYTTALKEALKIGLFGTIENEENLTVGLSVTSQFILSLLPGSMEHQIDELIVFKNKQKSKVSYVNLNKNNADLESKLARGPHIGDTLGDIVLRDIAKDISRRRREISSPPPISEGTPHSVGSSLPNPPSFEFGLKNQSIDILAPQLNKFSENPFMERFEPKLIRILNTNKFPKDEIGKALIECTFDPNGRVNLEDLLPVSQFKIRLSPILETRYRPDDPDPKWRSGGSYFMSVKNKTLDVYRDRLLDLLSKAQKSGTKKAILNLMEDSLVV